MKNVGARLAAMFKWCLPFVVLATLMTAMVYGAVQQSYRLSANDDLVEVSRGLADALANGRPLSSLAPQSTVDIAHSLSIYAIVYDETGTLVVSSATLDGTQPTVPAGVLDYTRTHGEDRVTWEPKKGVRQAIVAVHYVAAADSTSGFVVVGKSLSEIEAHESLLLLQIAAGWLFTVLLLFILASFYTREAKGEVIVIKESVSAEPTVMVEAPVEAVITEEVPGTTSVT